MNNWFLIYSILTIIVTNIMLYDILLEYPEVPFLIRLWQMFCCGVAGLLWPITIAAGLFYYIGEK